jgi:hypothetical protein
MRAVRHGVRRRHVGHIQVVTTTAPRVASRTCHWIHAIDAITIHGEHHALIHARLHGRVNVIRLGQAHTSHIVIRAEQRTLCRGLR